MGLLAVVAGCGTTTTTPPDETTTPCTDVTIYADADGDHVGAGDPIAACLDDPAHPPFGLAATAGDCNDHDPNVVDPIQGYADADGDHVTVTTPTPFCAAALPAGYVADVSGNDCNDHDPTVSIPQTYYPDTDGDGYGAMGAGTAFCTTSTPSGYGLDGSDPNDHDPAITPLDTDGDHVADTNDCAPSDPSAWFVKTLYADADHDSYTAGSVQRCIGASAPAGYSLTSFFYDCDDQDPTVAIAWTAYVDNDGDHYGTGSATTFCQATLPSGYSTNSWDCNDNDPSLTGWYPGYPDLDLDGFGEDVAPQLFCIHDSNSFPSGWVGVAYRGDCDDHDPSVYATIAGFPDADGDGYGLDSYHAFCAISLPAGYVTNPWDTNDADPSINIRHAIASVYQGQQQVCNGSACTGVVRLIVTGSETFGSLRRISDITVSGHDPVMWCLYTYEPIVGLSVQGYRNMAWPHYPCSIPAAQSACDQNFYYGGHNYQLTNVNLDGHSTGCLDESAQYLPNTITNPDVYEALYLVR